MAPAFSQVFVLVGDIAATQPSYVDLLGLKLLLIYSEGRR
jgi:hypothetical protein